MNHTMLFTVFQASASLFLDCWGSNAQKRTGRMGIPGAFLGFLYSLPHSQQSFFLKLGKEKEIKHKHNMDGMRC